MKKIFFLLLFCFLLVNAKAIDILGREDFDFTKKGNVYERTFRMPYNFWGSWVGVDICFGTTQTRINPYNVTEYETEWTKKLDDLWSGNSIEHMCEDPKDPQKDIQECYERMDRLAQGEIKALEAYHPNQYFKFKATFIPLANPEKKIEKITNIPLYHKPRTYKEKLTYDGGCINVISTSTKLWRKYYVKIEVLENTSFPSEIDIFRVVIYNSSRKY